MEPSNSPAINEVSSHFEAWRATRTGKARIPAHLWQEAIDLYPLHPIAEIAKSLRLSYTDFKKKLSQTNQSVTPTEFIRIDQTPGKIDHPIFHPSENDCQATTIELEKGDGSRLRIQRELNDQALLSIIHGYFGDASCYS